MKPLTLLLALSGLIAFASLATPSNNSESYRTFTDNQGRTIRAVVVRAGPEHVWIRRDDGRTFQIQRTVLSETDRRFVSSWERSRALQAENAVEFTVRRFADGQESASTESTRTTNSRFGYIVTITNNTTYDLDGLQVHYRFFALRGSLNQTGQNRPLERHAGSTAIALLPPRQTYEFRTQALTLTSTNLKPGWHYTNTNRRRTDDSLGGIWIRVLDGNEIVAEFSSPSRLRETETW